MVKVPIMLMDITQVVYDLVDYSWYGLPGDWLVFKEWYWGPDINGGRTIVLDKNRNVLEDYYYMYNPAYDADMDKLKTVAGIALFIAIAYAIFGYGAGDPRPPEFGGGEEFMRPYIPPNGRRTWPRPLFPEE